MTNQTSPNDGCVASLVDLAMRLRLKRSLLSQMVDGHPEQRERIRLRGKVEGVDLALSFIEEELREQQKTASGSDS